MKLNFLVIFSLAFSLSLQSKAKKHDGDFGTHPAPKFVPKKQKPQPAPVAEPAPRIAPARPEQKPAPIVVSSGNLPDGFKSPDDFAREWISRNPKDRPAVPNVQDDSQLVYAVQNRRDLLFVQANEVVVSQIMPDDLDGLQHQRWYVKLSNGESVFAVYNIDISVRVPVEINQKMKLGGEFKWTNQGALIHWLHADPKQKRPDGYVEVNGKVYGKVH